MCFVDSIPPPNPRKAAEELAGIFNTELGTNIDPRKLHGMLLLRWDRLSYLAHVIHDETRKVSSAQQGIHHPF